MVQVRTGDLGGSRLLLPRVASDPIWVRLADPSDRELLLDAFGGLSAQSRYRRFFTAANALEGPMLGHLLDIDGERHIAIAAVAINRDGERGVGVARSVRTLARPGEAELAVTVVDEFQRLGIGEVLVRIVIAIAARTGVNRFTATILSENRASLALFHKLGARLSANDDASVRNFDLEPSRVPQPEEWDADFVKRVGKFVAAIGRPDARPASSLHPDQKTSHPASIPGDVPGSPSGS